MRIATLILCGVILASCSRVTGSSPLPADLPAASLANYLPAGSGYKSLYSFKGTPDGSAPDARLISVGGLLYGTTDGGGTSAGGTVFTMSASGKERVLYSFEGGSDGAQPTANLTQVGRAFYGTTFAGGAGNDGTVFTVSRSGDERVLYRFKGGTDGVGPKAGVIALNGTLFGTTAGGGAKDKGTVFSVSTSGKERVLYSFKGEPDGDGPAGNLISVGGTLYGTTYYGGSGCIAGYGCGAIFAISTTGKERVLYRFQGHNDGAAPSASLISVGGTLYGTTNFGGGSGCKNGAGCGTLFAVSTAGKEHVLYRFKGGNDGVAPIASLLFVNGTLYGTTSYGGGSNCSGYGCGIVFAASTAGKERVLYSFKGGSDGALPTRGLTAVNGTLYGTTYYGGGSGCTGALGCGTIFRISP